MRIYDSSQLAHVAGKITLHTSLPGGVKCKHCGVLDRLHLSHQNVEYERHAQHGDIAEISETVVCTACGQYWTYRYIVSMAEQATHGL